MRALILLALILPAVAMADPVKAANAALDWDQASALAARARIEASNLPIPGCAACAAAWPAQKAAGLALQVSICEAGYPTSPEYSQACTAWWRTVFQ